MIRSPNLQCESFLSTAVKQIKQAFKPVQATATSFLPLPSYQQGLIQFLQYGGSYMQLRSTSPHRSKGLCNLHCAWPQWVAAEAW